MADDSPERWRLISLLFDEAVKLSPAERAVFLERACSEDADLRARVLELLESSAIPDPEAATTRSLAASGVSPGTIGPYRLQQKIGEGGMGEVWLAEQTEPIHRQVALKVIKAGLDTKQVVARFEAERQALALMDHPGIARVFDAGETPRGLPYFAMEYVKGEPITSYCDRHRLGTPERLGLFARVCEAVQHAHQKGVIHRDLKPSNVLVSIVGEMPQPKVIDFGVAKATAHRLTEKTMFTELGMLIGTPEYMSPEQAEMTGLDVDTRTDVYALGVMLYELLTGALPFESKELRQAGFEEIRRRIREVDPPKPSTKVRTLGERSTEAAKNRRTDPGRLISRLKGDLDWIVMKALEKDRTRRYGTPSDLAADLARHLKHEPVLAGPPGAAYRARKFVRRHRFGVAAAGLAVVGLAGFGVMMALQARAIARERDRAERVSEFLVELFKVSDPSEARGNSITAREVLDRGAQRIERELAQEPVVQAQMMATMGMVYRNLGLSMKAEPLAARAAELRQRVLGPEHPDTLRSRAGLAWIHQLLGRFEEAEESLRTVLDVQRRVLGNDHPDTLRTMDWLGVVYERVDRLEASGKLYREVLEGRRRVLGNDHADTLWSLNNVAANLEFTGHLPEAEKGYREVAEWRRRALGEDHPDTLEVLNHLARVIGAQGRRAEAEKLYVEVIEGRRQVLGKEHPATLYSMGELLLLYADQGRYEEAESLYRETIEVRLRLYGLERPGTLALMNNMGDVYIGMKRYDDAERLLLSVYETARRVFGEKHPLAWDATHNLARITALRGRKAEAIRWVGAALAGNPEQARTMEKDRDLTNLHNDPEFQHLLADAREKVSTESQ